MKLFSMLPALAGFLVLTACDTPSPALLSVDGVTTEKDTAADAALPGAWETPGDKDSLCIVRPAEQAGYTITFFSGSSSLGFQAQLFREGDAEFLDVTPADDNDFRLPGHAIARIWTAGTMLRWAFLDSDWLKQQAGQIATHVSDGKMLLLSPPTAVRAFLAANGANDKAYGKVVEWQRAR